MPNAGARLAKRSRLLLASHLPSHCALMAGVAVQYRVRHPQICWRGDFSCVAHGTARLRACFRAQLELFIRMCNTLRRETVRMARGYAGIGRLHPLVIEIPTI